MILILGGVRTTNDRFPQYNLFFNLNLMLKGTGASLVPTLKKIIKIFENGTKIKSPFHGEMDFLKNELESYFTITVSENTLFPISVTSKYVSLFNL